MIPAVPLPKDGGVRTPIDIKLKPEWHFDTKRRMFVSDSGEKFAPRGQLPKSSRIVYKVPSLVGADPARLSKHERDLRRYMQVILPAVNRPPSTSRSCAAGLRSRRRMLLRRSACRRRRDPVWVRN